MEVSLKWITPQAEKTLVEIARVSSDPNKAQKSTDEQLLRYFREHGHWSPFEMVSACFSIHTTRDIARQILRHRSFSFQEFSQRYQDATVLGEPQKREARLQDAKNRQNSLRSVDDDLNAVWDDMQGHIIDEAFGAYETALEMGIAKEQARALLPEGLTPSHVWMSGTIRSWFHYLTQRCDPATQKEHRDIANEIWYQLNQEMPTVFGAFDYDEA